MISKETALSILLDNLVPAFGCTDPATPALAAAIAYKEAGGGEVKKIDLLVSHDVYIGAHSVIIPGTAEKGLAYAVGLGIACGDPEKGLMALEGCSIGSVEKARLIIERASVNIRTESAKGKIYVDLLLETDKGRSRVIFDGHHEQYSRLEANRTVIGEGSRSGHEGAAASLQELPVEIGTLCALVDGFTEKDLEHMSVGAAMNRQAGIAGLQGGYGMNTAWILSRAFPDSLLEGYYGPKLLAGAAGDVRMGGGSLPVMSVFGSGNQGALIFNCISRFAEIRNLDKNEGLRAIALAVFIAGILNREIKGRTPFCNCAVIAATSTAAGITYLMGGDPLKIENAMQMTISSMAGLLCDGAKPNCSLKISLGAGMAVENAVYAMELKGKVSPDGILGKSYLESMRNLRKIGTGIRSTVEENIIDILRKKDIAGI